MFVVSQPVRIGRDFESAARKAVKAHFDKTGHAPSAVLIPSRQVTALENLAVGLGNPPMIRRIVIEVRADLGIKAGTFALDISSGALE